MTTIALPIERDGGAWRFAALAVLGSLVLAAFAQVRVPIGPIPITGQTLALLLLGGTMGPRGAGAAALLYLFEGAAGLPVFAGFTGGAVHLFGPTAGYLVAFVPAAWLAGAFAESAFNRTLFGSIAAMMLVHLVVLSVGAAWLSLYVGVEVALWGGFAVFLPVAAVKTVLALPAYWQPRRRI